HDSSGRKGRQATGKNSHNHPPSVHGGRSASAATPTRHRSDPPFLRGQVADAGQASGLVPSERGITVAGQRRDLTGFAGHNVILVRPRTGVLYRRNSWLGRHTMMAARRGLARPGSRAGGRTALAMTRADWLRPGTSERRPAPPATTRSAGGSWMSSGSRPGSQWRDIRPGHRAFRATRCKVSRSIEGPSISYLEGPWTHFGLRPRNWPGPTRRFLRAAGTAGGREPRRL